VPEAFAGTWQGQVPRPDALITTWTATLTLPAGQSTGTLRIAELACSGPVTVVARSGLLNTLTLRGQLRDSAGATCAGRGRILLTVLGPNRLVFDWLLGQGAGSTAHGILTRT
jgi:hypothetical protein